MFLCAHPSFYLFIAFIGLHVLFGVCCAVENVKVHSIFLDVAVVSCPVWSSPCR